MRFLILFLLLVGCSTTPTINTKRYPNVDKTLKIYVMRFDYLYYKHCNKHVSNNIDVKLALIKESEQAGGVYYRIQNKTIISLRHWPYWLEEEKEEVVFHELGHHVLRLNHDWSAKPKFKDGCPKSIMYYKGIDPRCYKKRRRYYIQELFKRGDDADKRFNRLRSN